MKIPELAGVYGLDGRSNAALLDALSRFLESGDPQVPRGFPVSKTYSGETHFGHAMIRQDPKNERAAAIIRFFVLLCSDATTANDPRFQFIANILSTLHCEGDKNLSVTSSIGHVACEEITLHHPSPRLVVEAYFLAYSFKPDWRTCGSGAGTEGFESPIANLVFPNAVEIARSSPQLLCGHSDLLGAMTHLRPDAVKHWCLSQRHPNPKTSNLDWKQIISNSDAFDDDCLAYCASLPDKETYDAWVITSWLNKLRENRYLEVELSFAAHPRVVLSCNAMGRLLEHRRGRMTAILKQALSLERPSYYMGGVDGEEYAGLCGQLVADWEDGGEAVVEELLAKVSEYNVGTILAHLRPHDSPRIHPAVRRGVARSVESLPEHKSTIWTEASKTLPTAFQEEFRQFLGNKSRPLREAAAVGLAKCADSGTLPFALDQLTAKSADARLGGVSLLRELADPAAIPSLDQALQSEASEKVRSAIHDAIQACGGSQGSTESAGGLPLPSVLENIAKESKRIKMPACHWLDASGLPTVFTLDASPLTATEVAFLIFKQSKHKTLDAAPDILPLLAHIDREKSPPFALALVEGFLNSEQAASDRWALALGGLLGDSRIIPPLLSRIPDWCENSRHKLAEYAAQAIALLPGNEPLMVLDSLSNRYRSKFKNVGKACAEAFNAAAAARGITADELGDMVVPDFGFDGDGIRRFEWDGGGASAELGADFKLSWFDPDTDRAWKSLPATAPAAVKDEVKTLGKLLREAVKAQTARLEMTLVRQLRWPVVRWRELFENHPLLRSFASSLAWGIYDASGTLLRTFRRYPNGLLANAAGELEELPEADTVIGMIHPLELDAAALDAWRAHLGRFKVKQPFPQIDRPVELMDPLHGNRREIALTKGGKVSAGTFRSRSEKRGWTRGSVVDAGGISSYYKLYPGAGVEVVLPTDNFYIGIDPMDTVELGAAYFAKAGSVERGSYTYDEPAPDDPRVLRFDQVPAVVWSETMSDLKAILGT